MNSPSHPAKSEEIHSELVVFPSINGRKITAYLDYSGESANATGYVVVAPKYGETKKNNLQLAYYLAANGLLVLRFDHTNHVGESEGGIVDFTFPSAIEDMRASVDYLERRFSAKKVTLIANSLSVRPAIRTFCKDDRIATLISVVGVVNFRSTVSIVYQRDLVGDHIAGVHHGVTDILGHEVNVAHFMDSCIEEKMHDYDGAMQDVERADGKLFFFYADKDAWVDSKDVKSLEKDFDHVHTREIKGAMHELRENPEGAEQALKEIVYVALHGRLGEIHELAQLVIPPKKTYLKQNRIERERLKKAEPIKETEREFWQAYLGKYDILEKVFDYQEYLDLIGERLGEIKDGHIVFDVGCGNGLFGVWCLRDILIKRRAEFGINPVYFGLDLTYKGLSEALQKHQAARFESRKQRMAATTGGLDMIYTPFDLDTLKSDGDRSGGLPFEDETFDKICCSLLISYLVEPMHLLRELHRVLKPGGTIILSSMKPYCDLSQIYKEFVVEEKPEEDIGRARNLISAAGAIRTKEEQGHYVFFTGEELGELMKSAGFQAPKAFRSFGDQANLVSAHK